MKSELISIIDRVESNTCKSHGEKAVIEIVNDQVEISCCCNEFKQRLERKIEYEFYKEFVSDTIKLKSVEETVETSYKLASSF
jgi:hypothetical protein